MYVLGSEALMYVVGAVIATVGGPRSIDHVWLSGVASLFPAASVARTSKVWLPSASAAVVCGLVQALQLPPSTRHSNVEPASDEWNVNAGVAVLSSAGGAESIVVSGAVRSIVHVSVAGVASVFPAGSVARTSKVWLPSASAAGGCGPGHDDHAPPSTRHSKVEPGSLALNAKLGVVLLEGLGGLVSIVVCGAVTSTVHVKLAGVASVLAAGSVARTSNVCVPSPSADVVCGVEHGDQLPPSTRHSNVEPASEEWNAKVGVVSLDGLAGLVSIVVCGAVRSTVQVCVAGAASMLPAASVARTSNVWLPSASGAVVCGLVQALQPPASTRHSNVEPSSEEWNANAGVALPDGLAGVESSVVSGAVRSIVQVEVAGVASVLPAVSVARTSNVWLPSPSEAVVCGVVQAAQVPPSTRHSNVEPASDELNANVGVASFDGSDGPEPSVVFGAVLSTRRLATTSACVWPTVSVATARMS